MNPKYRLEHDSMGDLEVPIDALYGAQTQRAINNFPISGQFMPQSFIQSLLQIKSAAAKANSKLACIDSNIAEAIVNACEALLEDDDLMSHFPVDVFQTGSGTSSNMNANEVIANYASKASNLEIHPNDHVNFGQSSNDVVPSAIHVSAAVETCFHLLPALEYLQNQITEKAASVAGICKTGRTHLMDAMPIMLDQSLSAWAAQILSNIQKIKLLRSSLYSLPQGGTAVGTGINTHPRFANEFCKELAQATNVSFTPAENKFALIASQDTAVALSGALKTTAVSIMKIANDLRWMNSGPLAGLGEITLEALQPGSSIMPGKVNPVIPEAAAMVSAQVIGNDAAITVGGQSGNFELNVMLPMIAYNLLESIEILSNASYLLADQAIASFEVNLDKLEESLHQNPILVTALNPIIGYQKAAKIAKQAYQEKRPIIKVAMENTELSEAELKSLLDPALLTQGGIK